MSFREQITADFLGEDSPMLRLPKAQDQSKFLEVPEGYELKDNGGGNFDIVPLGSQPTGIGLFVSAIEKRTVSAAWGSVLNLAANSLNLLPDDEKMMAELEESSSKKGIMKAWDAIHPKNIIAHRLWRIGTQGEKRIKTQRNRLASALDYVVNESQMTRSKTDKLYDLGLSVLGEERARVFEMAELSTHKTGGRGEPERNLATEVVAEARNVEEVVVIAREKIEDKKVEIILELGQKVALRDEVTRLSRILGNPTSEVPECEGGVTLVKAGFFEQLSASIFGAKGFSLLKSVAGGQEIYIAADGKVHLRTGVEDEVIATDVADVLPRTDISTPFENLKSVAVDKRLNLGPISNALGNFATRKGKDKLNLPGALLVQRSGADEEDHLVVADVAKVANSLTRVVSTARRVRARINDIKSSIPTIAYDENTFRTMEIESVKSAMASIPRLPEVVDEAKGILAKREAEDLEVLRRVGIKHINQSALKKYGGF